MTDQHHDTPSYSAADMEKYWQGLLSPAEMHAMEKAALDDPFLADALEGYRHLATAQPGRSAAQLAELKGRLSKRIRSTEKRPVSWWKPAVAAILIIGTGSLGYLFLRHSTPSSRDEVRAPHQQADSISSLVTIIPPAKDSTVVLPNDVAVLEPKTIHPYSAPVRAKQAKPVADEAASEAIADNPAPADETIAAAEKPKAVSATEKSEEKPALRDSSSIAGNVGKHQDALDEVVVTGYGTEKKRTVIRKETLSKNLSIEVQNAVPVKGWNDYNQYLKEQAVIPDSLREIHGQVVLLLEVKLNGKLNNITIEHSLHPVLDKEAERLVREGPAWKVLKGRKASVYVIVPF